METADPVAARVVALVAEQTGYPEDMLELDLDLEADLGIDTVKQAETFGAIQEEFDIPTSSDLSLRDYNTLEKVIGFVKEMRPDLAAAPASVPATPVAPVVPATPVVESTPISPAAEPADEEDVVAKQVIALVAEQTGYPEDMLELDLDLEADLGIDTVKQAETFLAIRETFDIPQRDDLNLRDYETLEKVIGFVKEMRPDLAAPSEPVTAPEPAAAPAAYRLNHKKMSWQQRCWPWYLSKPAIQRICWNWIWIWKRIWVSTRLNRRRPSWLFARPLTFRSRMT